MTSNTVHISNEITSIAIPEGSISPMNQNRSGESNVGPNTRAINQKPVRAETKNGLLPITPRRPIANIHNATMAQVKLIMPKCLITVPYARTSAFEYLPNVLAERRLHKDWVQPQSLAVRSTLVVRLHRLAPVVDK